MSSNQIKVLSLNCWGLKFVSKDRAVRIAAIAQYVSSANYDIVALQEIWVYADFERVRDTVSQRLPYSKFYYSGALGAGLAIISRFPIVYATIYPYSLNGAPIDVAAGDWFVGKAAATAVIKHPDLGQVQVFNTHLFAKGGDGGPEYNRAHRLVNAWELAKLARQAAELGRYVICAGDFNSIPSTLPMSIIRDHASLKDSWVESHPEPSSPHASSPEEAIRIFGVTADSPVNSYSAGKGIDPDTARVGGKRLDYVLYRQPQLSPNAASIPTLRCQSCQVVLTEKVPGQLFSYSDHFGLESTLEIVGPAEPQASETSRELTPASITTTISALTSCYRFSKERARKELITFGLCLLVLLALAIGSAWITYSWITPILIIVTVALSWFGTTMLYEGFLYGHWETNALMNVIEELELHKKALEEQL